MKLLINKVRLRTHFMQANFLWKKTAELMEGSLFFRGLTAMLNFFAKLMANSFVGRAFVGDESHLDNSIGRSFFAVLADKLLNGFTKPITTPVAWPGVLSRLATGSQFIGGTLDNLGATIPPAGEKVGIKPIFQWAFFALPVVGMALVAFATPFLPTMILAGLLLPVLLFTFLSRKFVIDGTAVFLLSFIVISGVAALLSLAPRSSIEIAILTSVFMFSTLVVVACAVTKKAVDFFIKIFVLSAAFAGLVGFYQVIAGFRGDGWLDQTLFGADSRIVSTFGNPNVYGTYLLLAIPLAAACVAYFKSKFTKLIAVGITGLLVINLALTLSRGCYLSLALSVAVFVLIIEKRLIVLFIPAVLALPLVLPANILARLLSILNFEDTSTAFRLNIWRGSIRIIQDFWMGGVGQGIEAYNAVYPFYSLAAIYSPHSHSLYIQYLVEVGLFGFLIFIVMLACFFRTMANFLRRTKDFGQRIMAAAMVAAVIGFLFQGVTDFVFYNYRVLLAFYIFIGICIAFARVHSKVEKA